MPRPKKKEIVLSKDSVLSLMQEIYNELVEQRATAIRIQNKLIAMMNNSKDMPAISGILKEQQKKILSHLILEIKQLFNVVKEKKITI